jgi:hypothetical protein
MHMSSDALAARNRAGFGFVAAMVLAVAVIAPTAAAETTVRINFTRFLDGIRIPNETLIRDQFESVGVRFAEVYPDGPRALTALGGILISGGPTGFFGDVRMEFASWCAPTVVNIDLIGSGIPVGATVSGYSQEGLPIGTVTYTYNLSSGQLAPMAFIASQGLAIATLIYNGGLGSGGAASMGTLRFACR